MFNLDSNYIMANASKHFANQVGQDIDSIHSHIRTNEKFLPKNKDYWNNIKAYLYHAYNHKQIECSNCKWKYAGHQEGIKKGFEFFKIPVKNKFVIHHNYSLYWQERFAGNENYNDFKGKEEIIPKEYEITV